MPAFSIVIPNWNGKRFLAACFDSIANQTLAKNQIETILVDDCSNDDSIDFTKEHYPWVRVIKKEHNSGFAQTVNVGIEAATGSFITLLNNDTEVDPNWLEAMQEAINQFPEASFFASKMLDFKDRTILDSCGDAMTWTGRSFPLGQLQKDGPEWNTPTSVFGACAGAAVYKKEVFEKIGLFDADFGTYLEDVDIDFRAQLAGFRCVFVPTARVYHIGSATAGKGSPFSFKMMIKNHFHLIYKNFPASKFRQNIGKLLYAEIRLMAAAIRQGYLNEYFWACGQAFRQWSVMRPKRRLIQANRKVDDAYLDTVISSTFQYKPLVKALRHA